MKKNHIVLCGIAFFLLSSVVLPFNRMVNYTSTLRVNDFVLDNDVLWVASSGGLYRLNTKTGIGTLYNDPSQFPDPDISCLYLDVDHTLWVGTVNGYLYKRPVNGRTAVVSSYSSVDWGITDIASYGNYLIVGSKNGCSVFDKVKLIAIKNATGFGTTFSDPQVNTIAIFRDTLLLGCAKGLVKLYVAGNVLSKSGANFYDPSIWTIDTVYSSSVKSILLFADGYHPMDTLATLFNGQILSSVPTIDTGYNYWPSTPTSDHDVAKGDLLVNGNKIGVTLPSAVTAIAAVGNGICCIGTKFNYFYLWDGNDTTNIKIDGPTFTTATRIYVDREDQVWACPLKANTFLVYLRYPDLLNPWWEGISVFRNGRWDLYSPAKYSTMGMFGGGGNIRGVSEDPQGRMWFGTPGGQVKRYDQGSDSWLQYCVGAQDFGQGRFFQSLVCASNNWAESDAVACDSTGFLWIAAFDNNYGSLICHDPSHEPDPDASDYNARHFRYFFPTGDPNHSKNIGCLCVDAANNVIVGDGDLGANGRIQVLSYHGNPLLDSVVIKADFSDNHGIVYDAAATRDTLTYIATSTGFYTYDPSTNTLKSGLCVRTWDWIRSRPADSVMDSTLKEIRAVEVEDERIIWLGTINAGLIRYDLSNGSKTIVDETQGLLSNAIWDLSMDRRNGYLWIASDRGVTRYALGYNVGSKNIGTALVYPNPFSKRQNRELLFQKLPPSSNVLIYSVAGTLVAKLSPEQNSVYGSACVWKPPSAIAPGLYLYTVSSSTGNSRGKIIVTP
jgi:hypothetical protein